MVFTDLIIELHLANDVPKSWLHKGRRFVACELQEDEVREDGSAGSVSIADLLARYPGAIRVCVWCEI